MNKAAPPSVLPQGLSQPAVVVPQPVLDGWRVQLEAHAAIPQPAQRDLAIGVFFANPNRPNRIAQFGDSRLLGAACRAVLCLTDAAERQALATQLITPRTTVVVGSSGDAGLVHDMSRTMHQLPPAPHAEALRDLLLTSNHTIPDVVRSGQVPIVADLSYDTATRLAAGAQRDAAMAGLLTNETVDAVMASDLPEAIGKTAFATGVLPAAERAERMERVALSHRAVTCMKERGNAADVGRLVEALAAHRSPAGGASLRDLMAPPVVGRTVETGSVEDMARLMRGMQGLPADAREALWPQLFTRHARTELAGASSSRMTAAAIGVALTMQNPDARAQVLDDLMPSDTVARAVAQHDAHAGGLMAIAATHLPADACHRVLNGLLAGDFPRDLARDAAALFRVTAALRSLPETQRADAMASIWSPGAIDAMKTSGDISAVSFIGGAMANWLPEDRRAASLAALLPDDAVFQRARASGRPDIVERMKLAAAALPEERRGPAQALLEDRQAPAAPPTWQQIMAGPGNGAKASTAAQRTRSPSPAAGLGPN